MISKEMTIGEVLRLDRRTAAVFMEMGMHCLGCPMSAGESIEQACAVHGVNADKILEKLNAVIVK